LKVLVGAKEAGNRLGVSRWTIWRWTRRGRIGSVLIDRMRRYDVEELERFAGLHARAGIMTRKKRR
jgi:excisionase family DNA binding protein